MTGVSTGVFNEAFSKRGQVTIILSNINITVNRFPRGGK